MSKNPWRDEMTPEEFRDHYERKRDRIDGLSGECAAGGCENEARWPRETCSNACKNQRLRDAAGRLDELMENDDE